MLIRNYGLFWQRDDVFWGRQKNSGHLKGRAASAKKSEPVDFRSQVGLYALYDENYKLVYFGQAGRGKGHKLFNRLKDHCHDRVSDRWTRFSWFGTRYVKANNQLSAEKENHQGGLEIALDHMEAIVLAVSEPPHNRQGGRFGTNVVQYLQYRDEDVLGLNDREMLAAIYRNQVSSGDQTA